MNTLVTLEIFYPSNSRKQNFTQIAKTIVFPRSFETGISISYSHRIHTVHRFFYITTIPDDSISRRKKRRAEGKNLWTMRRVYLSHATLSVGVLLASFHRKMKFSEFADIERATPNGK